MVLWSGKGEGGRGTLHFTHLKRKTTRRKHKKTERKKIRERSTRVHVSAEGGLAASKINCANNSCPKKDKRAGVGIGSQSWPGLLKHEEKAGRNPGLDRLRWTAASDQPVREEMRSRRQESGWAATGGSWLLPALAIGHQPSAIAISHQPSAISHRPSAIALLRRRSFRQLVLQQEVSTKAGLGKGITISGPWDTC